MRNFIFGLITVLSLACCGDYLKSKYILDFPQPPKTWVSLLGEPHWRVEWLDPAGRRQIADFPPRTGAEVELPVTWTNPVTAWPYWPGSGLPPGLFKPAGALFPFDVAGKRLPLSWKAGPDTIFYRELANAADEARSPVRFDWPRFRELFESDALNESVCTDPWLVDWRSVAEKTVSSGFDRRRLVPQPRESITIPVPSGPWYGSSPFAQPLHFAPGETPVFPVIGEDSSVDVWISAQGILRCNRKTWMFEAWGQSNG